MRALNEALIERKVEARFVTLLLMLWSPAIRQFVMANAGGNPPLVCRNREILKPRVEGVPLGLLDEREYEEVVFQAHHGDTIVLYSDGVTDHLSPDGQDYGRHRLSQVVRRVCDQLPRGHRGGDPGRSRPVQHYAIRRPDAAGDEGEMMGHYSWGRTPVLRGSSRTRSVPQSDRRGRRLQDWCPAPQ